MLLNYFRIWLHFTPYKDTFSLAFLCIYVFEVYLFYFIYLSCTFPDINVTWYFLLWHFEEKTLQKRWLEKLTKCSIVATSINSILNSRWLSIYVIMLCVLKLQYANKRITQTRCCYITTSCHLCQTNSKLVLPWFCRPLQSLSTHMALGFWSDYLHPGDTI